MKKSLSSSESRLARARVSAAISVPTVGVSSLWGFVSSFMVLIVIPSKHQLSRVHRKAQRIAQKENRISGRYCWGLHQFSTKFHQYADGVPLLAYHGQSSPPLLDMAFCSTLQQQRHSKILQGSLLLPAAYDRRDHLRVSCMLPPPTKDTRRQIIVNENGITKKSPLSGNSYLHFGR